MYSTKKKYTRWYNSEPLTNLDLPSPTDFFKKYIPDSLFDRMANMTNLYAIQKGVAHFQSTTAQEMKQFIGIHIVTGNLNFPRTDMYSNTSHGILVIKENMKLKKFYKLRQTLSKVS